MIYKFNQNTIVECEKCTAYKVYKHFENGGKFKDLSPLEKSLFNELGHGETYRLGHIRVMGWMFDFSGFFKTYLVKYKYFGWIEQKAPNKTFIRENSVNPSYIIKIMEIDN